MDWRRGQMDTHFLCRLSTMDFYKPTGHHFILKTSSLYKIWILIMKIKRIFSRGGWVAQSVNQRLYLKPLVPIPLGTINVIPWMKKYVCRNSNCKTPDCLGSSTWPEAHALIRVFVSIIYRINQPQTWHPACCHRPAIRSWKTTAVLIFIHKYISYAPCKSASPQTPNRLILLMLWICFPGGARMA